MNPVSWTQKRGFCMEKVNYAEKIKIYERRKAGEGAKKLAVELYTFRKDN